MNDEQNRGPQQPTDRELQTLFGHLREIEQANVPEFERFLEGRQRTVSRLRKRVASATAFATAVLLCVAVVGLLRQAPAPPVAGPIEVESWLHTWQMPSDFLLEHPGHGWLTMEPQQTAWPALDLAAFEQTDPTT